MAGNARERVFFVHLQKTAGTALWRRLKQQFAEHEVYPGPGDGELPESVLSVDHLLKRWNARRDEIHVVTGHFPLCTAELLGARFSTITIVRDPVERTLSHLRHHRETTPADQDTPFEVIYRDPTRRRLVRNHMVKMLSLTTEEMVDGALTEVDFTPERVERAKRRLSEMDVVGLQERFEDFCAELTRRFGWNLGPPIFMNRTTPVPVPTSFAAEVAADNAADVELYDFARTHCAI
jgi:hypothetical protein